jgi:hypothetical protein
VPRRSTRAAASLILAGFRISQRRRGSWRHRIVTPNLVPPQYVAPPSFVPHQVLPQSVEPARIQARSSLEEGRAAEAAPLPGGGGSTAYARHALEPHRMPLLGGASRPISSVRLSTNHDWHHWRRVPGFLGWAGPLYWPYAYDDIYDDVLCGGPRLWRPVLGL